jgi:hypothetical protein
VILCGDPLPGPVVDVAVTYWDLAADEDAGPSRT